MLSAVETFFSGMGIILFATGAVLCALKLIRRGIVLMLIGDFFFLVAILYPKKVSFLLLDLGLDKSSLEHDLLFLGLIFGALLDLCLFGLNLRFTRYPKKEKPQDAVTSQPRKQDPDSLIDGKADPNIFAGIKRKSR